MFEFIDIPDVLVEFLNPSYTAIENELRVTFTIVARTASDRAITILFSTSDGSALGNDYTEEQLM